MQMYFFFKINLANEYLQDEYFSIRLFSFSYVIHYLLLAQVSLYPHSPPTAITTFYPSNAELILEP